MKIVFFYILAIGIRIFLMLFAYHPDLRGQALSTYFFSYEGVTNIYDHLASLPANHPLVKNVGVTDIFIYPPLTYFTLGSFQLVLKPFLNKSFFEGLMNGVSVYNLNTPQNLFFLKLPYLFVDIAAGLFLSKLFTNKKQSNYTWWFWLFNPISLYATYAMGVFDIIPVFFTILSLYFVQRNKLMLAALAIGFGTAFKSYPLFLLPLVVMLGQDIFTKIKITISGLAPYILSILPYLSSSAFKYMVFSPKSQKMFYLLWPVSGGEGIYPFIFFLILLIIAVSLDSHAIKNIWLYFLGYFLLLFSVTNFHPQWFLWVTPLLIVELVVNNFSHQWLTISILACFTFLVFMFDNSLTVGLFSQLNHQLAYFPGFASIIGSKTDIGMVKSIVRSIFAACCASLFYLNYKKYIS